MRSRQPQQAVAPDAGIIDADERRREAAESHQAGTGDPPQGNPAKVDPAQIILAWMQKKAGPREHDEAGTPGQDRITNQDCARVVSHVLSLEPTSELHITRWCQSASPVWGTHWKHVA